ncbi:GH25 family lysozyme [Lysinibacillus capsici]|uniref:GH25 family lysozyme n=1 Tax=Lysinibacillus capsici TaxID=2115968 RepID=UPI002E225184|nr:GH25 family lysozyme [Lysinibacillus capsici]
MNKKIIDISHHQGNIDWEKASKEVSLAIIRTQYGISTIDRKYNQNIKGCQKNNVPFGVYIYVTFQNVTEALVQAEDFYNRASGYSPLFYVVDVEESFGANVQNIVSGTQAFIDYLKNKNVKVGLYTGHHFYKPYKIDTVKGYDFLWIPRYSGTKVPGKKPDYPCDLWQYTDKGNVQGIKGNVDLNLINGSKPLSWFTNTNEREGDLTLSQYNELKQEITALKSLLAEKASVQSNQAVSASHKGAWEWAIREGLIQGNGTSMNPAGVLTREQIATILKRYHNKYIK